MEGSRSAQSAMEYLMTYGWAILIILIVLAVLYILGVFNPSGILGNQCNAQFKYSCTGATLSTNGSVSFLLGQNTGTNQYNVEVACTAVTNSSGGPYASSSPWISVTSELDSGTSVQVNGTPCFSSTGALLGTQNLGVQFTGVLWERYTTSPAAEGGANSWVLQPAAKLQIAVSRSGGAGASTTSTGSTSSTSTTSTTTTSIQPTFATASKTVAGTSLNVTPTGKSLYICGGVASGGSSSPYSGLTAGWSTDVADAQTGGPYSSIGHSSTGCSATTTETAGPNLTIAAIGMTGAPAYSTVLGTDINGNGWVNLTYSVSSSNTLVVLTGTCGYEYGPCEAAQLPSGCTMRQSITDALGYDNAYIATCQSQTAGSYHFNYSISCLVTRSCAIVKCMAPCNWPITSGVYIFPNYTPIGS